MLGRYMLPISSNRLLKYATSVKWCMFSCFLFKLENLVFFSKLNRTKPYNNTICLGLCNDYFLCILFCFCYCFSLHWLRISKVILSVFFYYYYLIINQILMYVLQICIFKSKSYVKVTIKTTTTTKNLMHYAFCAKVITGCHKLKQTRVCKELRGDC